jgi:hypothetical protein
MGNIRHDERTVAVAADVGRVFAYLDDPARLGAHMSEPSAMMMGGRMSYTLDTTAGQEVGSIIGMSGSLLGLRLALDQVVTERVYPTRKVWETIGKPQLVIIDWYRMGFQISPTSTGCDVKVFIDYSIPSSLVQRILGALLAPAYARWCIARIARDAERALRPSTEQPLTPASTAPG